MASRVVTQGLVSPDRITRVSNDILDCDDDVPESNHLTVHDLLMMPEAQRNEVMGRAFDLASKEDFEIFEADEFYELGDVNGEALH